MSQVMVEVELRIMQIPAGTGPVMLGQQQANQPGFGGTALGRPAGFAQMMFKNDAVLVPGTNGAVTLANMLTALQQAAADFAAASGTVLISAADLAVINGWQTGSP